MNCPKCNYDFGTLEPKYCPNCGKKVAPKEEKPNNFRNLDYLRFADYPRFTECLQSAPVLDPCSKEFFEWAFAPHDPVEVYVIKAEMTVLLRNHSGSLRDTWDKTDSRVDEAHMWEYLTARDTYHGVRFSVCPVVLSSRFSPALMNKNWWWHKEEAIAFANAVIAKYGSAESDTSGGELE